MKQLMMIACTALFCWYCKSTPKVTQKEPETINPVAMARTTHKEAIDTLLADTSAPVKPLIIQPLDKAAAKTLLAGLDLKTLLVKEWPDNGFYGNDNYRIEFIFNEADKTVNDPTVYAIKGKNRFKKTVSNWAGLIEITDLAEFRDPNLDSLDLANMDIGKAYTATGKFRFNEDSTLNTSGVFAGTFKLDFCITKTGELQAWYYSFGSPTKGAGYIFEGNWTSYKLKMAPKPVLFARDLFMIANNILTDFSYGEREVEINPKYRHLGWENFWDGEEWWASTPAVNN